MQLLLYQPVRTETHPLGNSVGWGTWPRLLEEELPIRAIRTSGMARLIGTRPPSLGARFMPMGASAVSQRGLPGCSAKDASCWQNDTLHQSCRHRQHRNSSQVSMHEPGFQSIVIKDGVNVYFLYSMGGSSSPGAEEEGVRFDFPRDFRKQLSTMDICQFHRLRAAQDRNPLSPGSTTSSPFTSVSWTHIAV